MNAKKAKNLADKANNTGLDDFDKILRDITMFSSKGYYSLRVLTLSDECRAKLEALGFTIESVSIFTEEISWE